jgi:hypothetical protein
MTDYNSLKVVDLRGLLKQRGIAATGLTKKAQFVAKLEEADREAEAEPEVAEDEQDPTDQVEADQGLQNEENKKQLEDAQVPADPVEDNENKKQLASGDKASGEPQLPLPEAQPNKKSGVSIESQPVVTDDQLELEENTSAAQTSTNTLPDSSSSVAEPSQTPAPTTEQPSIPPTADVDMTSAPQEPQKIEEDYEDSKKRKRRSATPPVDESEVAKKKRRQTTMARCISRKTRAWRWNMRK